MAMKTLGKYQIIEKLGEGATAEVFHALDTTSRQEVALKLLKPALVADPSAFDRFQREASTAAGLHHPNIASVYEMGEIRGRYFIALHYSPGRSLDKVLKADGPLSWPQTLRLAGQLGEALDHAHASGFLHRDVKPSNIIVSGENFILTDFGLTRAMMNTGLTSYSGAILGTPPYIPPEVWLGKPALPATDQYALACVVYEALTGQLLFSGETPPAIMTRHVLDGFAFPERRLDNIPKGLEAVLSKALAKDPAGRYETASTFAAALGKLVDPAAERLRLEQEKHQQQEAAEKAHREAEEQAAVRTSSALKPVSQPSMIPPASAMKTSKLAIVSLVAGIFGVVFLTILAVVTLIVYFLAPILALPILGSLIAVVTGHLAKNRIKQGAGRISGNGMATAGLILGYIGLVFGIGSICLWLLLAFGPTISSLLYSPAY